MRCIEMQRKLRYPLWDLRLTLTWDVLKYIFSISVLWLYGININMRCIEMKTGAPTIGYPYGLTLTWDVLKYIYYRSLSRKSLRLTLTWDVLKLGQ